MVKLTAFSLKSLKLLVCAAVVAITCIIAASADVGVGTVNGDILRLRAEPNMDSTVLTQAVNGDMVAILSQTGDWHKVAYKGAVGYMKAEYLTFAAVESADLGTAMVLGSNVRMRSGPGTGNAIITEYSNGTKVQVIGINNGWFKVTTSAGTGYILSDYITYESNAVEQKSSQPEVSSASYTAGEAIVNYAYQFLGTPYVWAGTSPSGFDCSGFTYYVYQQMGYTIERVASSQYYGVGTYVDQANLIPGDLVFFTSSSQSIGHVGIYVGNGEFIHSSSGNSYCVIVSSLYSDNYSRRYVGAKRVA